MEEDYECGEGSRGEDVGGAAEVPWFVQPREEAIAGRPHRQFIGSPRGK